MQRTLGTRRLRGVLAALMLLMSVSVVLAHTYRLDDTGDFIVHDDSGVRRLVVARGTEFHVSVLDTSGCTADIRASKGSSRIVAVANPRSDGFVANHQFRFTAKKAGTTTYDIAVRGEAFGGGNAGCDEDSHNPLEITVVEPGGDDRFFAAAVRPEVKSFQQASRQLQADLRKQYGIIAGDFIAGRVTFLAAMQQISLAFNLAFFQQGDLARALIDDMRSNARTTLLADPVRSLLGVPTGLLRGGNGAWDAFVGSVGGLASSSRDRMKADTRTALGRIVTQYGRVGGIAAYTEWFDCDDCWDCEGVTLEDDVYTPKPSVRLSNILSLAYREPDANEVVRQILVAGKAIGDGLNSVDIVLSDRTQEVGRDTKQVQIESRFLSTQLLGVDALGVDFRVAFESSDVTLRGRGERFQAPLLLVTPKIIKPR